MGLAAHSLGSGSCWIGVFNRESETDSSEERKKEVLRIPKPYRVVSLRRTGVSKYFEEKDRKELSQLVYHNVLHGTLKE